MKRNYYFILLLLVPLLSAQASVVRILAIGNSFSQNTVEHDLSPLALANGDTLIIGNAYISGCSLDKHWANAQENATAYEYRKIIEGKRTNVKGKTLLECIKDEPWDYISFQQVSTNSGESDTYAPLLPLMNYVADHVVNKNVKYVLHATWAFEQTTKHWGFERYQSDQMCMYTSIANAVKVVIEKINGSKSDIRIEFVIPSGTAIQNGRTSYIGDKFCDSDGFHLNLLGRYTAACVWLEMITGKSAVGNGYKPSDIDEKQAKIAQISAHNAVMNPYKITPWQ